MAETTAPFNSTPATTPSAPAVPEVPATAAIPSAPAVPEAPVTTATTVVTTVVSNTNTGASAQTRTIVTILLLLFMNPIGILTMFFWSKWPIWLKILLFVLNIIFTIIMIPIIAVFMIGFAAALNPKLATQMAQCTRQCQGTTDSAQRSICTQACIKSLTPSGTSTVPSIPSTETN